MNWYLKVMKNYAGFTGRARRKEYWMFVLLYLVFAVLLSLVGGIISQQVGSTLMLIFGLVHLVPSIAVGVRRLHDIDKSGWWLLIAFVPLVGGIVLLVFAVLEGTKGPNRFGPDPTAEPVPG